MGRRAATGLIQLVIDQIFGRSIALLEFFDLALSFVLRPTIFFLNFTGQNLAVTVNLIDLVAGQFASFFLDVSFDLFPVSLDGILVHDILFCCWGTESMPTAASSSKKIELEQKDRGILFSVSFSPNCEEEQSAEQLFYMNPLRISEHVPKISCQI